MNFELERNEIQEVKMDILAKVRDIGKSCVLISWKGSILIAYIMNSIRSKIILVNIYLCLRTNKWPRIIDTNFSFG